MMISVYFLYNRRSTAEVDGGQADQHGRDEAAAGHPPLHVRGPGPWPEKIFLWANSAGGSDQGHGREAL